MRFCALLSFLGAFALPALADEGACSADRIDERVRVSFVQDGDTLMLGDGRRIRLIGINTPELGKQGREVEPGAIAARDRLRQILFSQHQQLSLRFDEERHDRYGRLLAHAFLSDGRNLVELLLAAGAGAQLVVPPNTWQSACYQAVTRAARQQRKGVWALPRFAPVPVEQLDLRSSGFHVVRGRVSHLSNSASALWINLVGNFALRVQREDLGYFQGLDLDALPGREIEAQGWVQARNGQLRMQLRHPSTVSVLPPALPSGNPAR